MGRHYVTPSSYNKILTRFILTLYSGSPSPPPHTITFLYTKNHQNHITHQITHPPTRKLNNTPRTTIISIYCAFMHLFSLESIQARRVRVLLQLSIRKHSIQQSYTLLFFFACVNFCMNVVVVKVSRSLHLYQFSASNRRSSCCTLRDWLPNGNLARIRGKYNYKNISKQNPSRSLISILYFCSFRFVFQFQYSIHPFT